MTKFKAFIRVVKSITEYNFASEDIIREPLIESKDKNEVENQAKLF